VALQVHLLFFQDSALDCSLWHRCHEGDETLRYSADTGDEFRVCWHRRPLHKSLRRYKAPHKSVKARLVSGRTATTGSRRVPASRCFFFVRVKKFALRRLRTFIAAWNKFEPVFSDTNKRTTSLRPDASTTPKRVSLRVGVARPLAQHLSCSRRPRFAVPPGSQLGRATTDECAADLGTALSLLVLPP